MGMLSRFAVFAGLGFSADTQPMRLDTDFNLLWVESRDLRADSEVFARFREVELRGCHEFRFREKPIFAVVSVRVSETLENLKGPPSNQMEHVLRMFEKFMNGNEIQI